MKVLQLQSEDDLAGPGTEGRALANILRAGPGPTYI